MLLLRASFRRNHSSMSVIFRQLFDKETSTYTYLLGSNGSAILIDPVLEQAERDTELLRELNLDLKYAMNTHVHADHITSSGMLKKTWRNCQSVLGATGNEVALADVKIENGQTVKIPARS